MIIGVPSGIGDISWIYSKLMHLEDQLDLEVADGWPYRSVPYLEMLPRVKRARYGDFNYQQIIAFETANAMYNGTTWNQVPKSPRILIEANRHLEAGKRLEQWLPDLPCSFHYPMITTEQETSHARAICDGLRHPLVGISAA